MTSTPTSAPSSAPTVPRLSLFRRVGLTLVAPERALALVQARSGGIRDALFLVVIAAVCFRLEDLARAGLMLTNGNAGAMLSQALAVISQELRDAVFIAIPAGLIITLVAGRGRRDPSVDLELAAVAYTPYFVARTIFRTLDADFLLGPLSRPAHQAATLIGLLGAGLITLFACRLARRRPAPPSLEAGPRVALIPGAIVALLLVVALVNNARWVGENFATVKPLRRGSVAPSFSLSRVDGAGQVSLAQLQGKVVLLDFWATWCAPCVHMLPVLHELYGAYRDKGVEFVGINADGPGIAPADLTAFVRQHAIPYPTLFDPGEVGERYRVSMLPHMVLVDRRGVVHAIFSGVTARSELESAIQAALAAQ